MLACYLDDSDANVSKVETIAGYVADEASWARFELLADRICEDEGVELIRGRELDGRAGCFKGWSMPKIERFLERIGLAMSQHLTFGISRSIGKDHYKLRKRQLKLDPNLSGFGFCFGTISFALRHEEGFPLPCREQAQNEGVAYLLEAGSRNNPDIFRYVDQERRNGNLHVNTTVTEVDKRSCRAIQVADLYAFYSRRRMNKYARFKGRVEFIPDLHQLHISRKFQHDTGYIEEPYTSATNNRTGETFYINGLIQRP
ncbi:DUF3800 domain-containing protein [Rhizorhabdus histidinilytica]|uniref:DUF3800 domain-containing protein n=1 Tax=Rhizorhabdus histidinilytica TaxID=439228 RepID=UPI00321FC94C